MKISTKGRYALRLMLDLALNNTGEAVSLKDIARRQDISDVVKIHILLPF
jgi:Rrf2 family transcriptional regulator, cysteine metabolism repressor